MTKIRPTKVAQSQKERGHDADQEYLADDGSGIKDMFYLQQNVPGLVVGQSQATTTSGSALRQATRPSNSRTVTLNT